jgi:hypothetical protein
MAAPEGEEVTAEVAAAPGPAMETHLILFINGLNGHEANWEVVIENLRKTGSTDGMALLASTSNMRLKVGLPVCRSLTVLPCCFPHAVQGSDAM